MCPGRLRQRIVATSQALDECDRGEAVILPGPVILGDRSYVQTCGASHWGISPLVIFLTKSGSGSYIMT